MIDKTELYNNAREERVVTCSELLAPFEKAPAKKKYVIGKDGYAEIAVVSLTEGEATAISNFINWACLEDNFVVVEVENYSAEDWGGEIYG